ncbi:MAG: ligase-associated DNA damage response DEXH box helicase [Planctomycetia bacterium]|nr:ligase-associated DNA damage response DEXH box helicase [Planctomycetia bacterium]
MKHRTPRQTILDYFESRGQKPFRFQQNAWKAYEDGSSGLVHSATGTGKTLAVWLGPILEWLRQNKNRDEWNPKSPPALRVLWITPLKALAGDTENALRVPLESMRLPWRLESRTGDSRASIKAKQLKQLPTALITTPESLCLLLTHAPLQAQLSALEGVIVDEWHELLGSKRGIQVELALARLRKLNPSLRTWGLSATLGNLTEAGQALVGCKPIKQCRIIHGTFRKRLRIESLIPERIERFPWSGHIGARMVPQVSKEIEHVKSALVFANTRSQTEIWYQHLLQHRPDWAGQIAVHHGSLDASVREWVEKELRSGRLRAVVCTSSLDLGVDFSAVDLVMQIGSPKGSARLLQRAGRSGHQPGAESRLVFIPTNALELVELAAAKAAIKQGKMEARPLLSKPLDVLVQHVVTIAIGGGFTSEKLLQEVRTTQAYRFLTSEEWHWLLTFVVHGGSSLGAYPEFHRVQLADDRYHVSMQRIITLHRFNIGTIVSDTAIKVKYVRGGTIGMVEETFLSKLKRGDRFLLAGKLVELVVIRDNIAYVRRSKGKPNSIPRWTGGRMPLSSELCMSLREKIDEASHGHLLGPEMRSLKSLFDLQQRWSLLPQADELLIEMIGDRSGSQVFLFPFEGRLVHEGMASVLAYRLTRQQPTTLSMACNDHGIVLQSPHPIAIEKAISEGLFSTDHLEEDIHQSMNANAMAKRQFRQIARVSGLIQSGPPGQRKSTSYVQASSNLFFDLFCEYDPTNLLLEQCRREVLEQQFEWTRLDRVLKRLQQATIRLTYPTRVTPFAFSLMVDKFRERVSSETLSQRIARMQNALETKAGK